MRSSIIYREEPHTVPSIHIGKPDSGKCRRAASFAVEHIEKHKKTLAFRFTERLVERRHEKKSGLIC